MLRRLAKASLCTALLCVAVGCIEMKQTITLNPDGKGKVAYDVVMPADIGGGLMGAGGKEKTLDQKKQETLVKTLTGEHMGVTAWKDVSMDWTADGRLHFIGTAYFDNISQVAGQNDTEHYEVTRDKDTMKITVKVKANNDAKKDFPDLATLKDKELNEFILNERVKYQSGKPVMMAMLTDFKYTVIIHLPGEVSDLKAFKKDGAHEVSRAMDGNAVLASYKKFMAQDDATLKKKIMAANSLDFEKLAGEDIGILKDGSLTVAKIGPALFDYDKEVKEALAAYPKMRKQLNIPDATKLPGEAATEKPK